MPFSDYQNERFGESTPLNVRENEQTPEQQYEHAEPESLMQKFIRELGEEINGKYGELADWKARRSHVTSSAVREKEAYIRGLEQAKMSAELMLTYKGIL